MKLFLIMLGIFLISFVSAGNSEINYFYESEGTPLTGVQMLMYKCTNDYCTQVNEQLENINSGTNNFVSFTYPTLPGTAYYLKWYLVESYIPKVYRTWQIGTGELWTRTYFFNKVQSCHSPVDSFSITNSNYVNEPVVINVTANLEADASSAFSYNYDYFVPQGYNDHFSAETTATLTIKDSSNNIVYTDSKELNLYMDTFENIQFEWTPKYKDTYTAAIETDVVDCQCESSFKETTSRIFEVWPERPLDQCYTIINDLVANPETAEQDETVQFLFNKISNYVDSSGDKKPIPTKINYEIRDSSNNLIYSDNFVVEANENEFDVKNVVFDWLASATGYLNVKVTGVAQSSSCEGKTNPEDIAILGLQVGVSEMYDVTFVVTDSTTEELLQDVNIELGIYSGETDSQGMVSFNVNPNNYDYEISKTGYYMEAGNINVDGNETITIDLNPIQNQSITNIELLFPTGGETLSNNVLALWNATNNQKDPLLISIEYSVDNGAVWVVLGDNEPNDGRFLWNTENYDNGEYLLRVGAINQLQGEIVYDTSGEFTLDNEDGPIETTKSKSCIPLWECTEWGLCVDGMKSETCIDLNFCGEAIIESIGKIPCGQKDLSSSLIKLSDGDKEPDFIIIFLIIFIFILIALLVLLYELLKR